MRGLGFTFIFCFFSFSLHGEPRWRDPQALNTAAKRLGYLTGSRMKWSSVNNLPIDAGRSALQTSFLLGTLAELNVTRFHYTLGKTQAERSFRAETMEAQFLQKLRRNPLEIFVDDNMGRPVSRGLIKRTTTKGVTTLTDTLGRTSNSLKNYVAMVRREAFQDLGQTVELSMRYPQVQGWQEDDFLAKRKWATVLDREFFRSACRAARQVNPNFKIQATIYCFSDRTQDLEGERAAYASFMTNITKYKPDDPARQVEAFLQYASDPEIHSCISGVALFHQGTGGSPGAVRPWEDRDVRNVNKCVDRLRTNGKPITLGIYVAGYQSLGLGDSVHNLDEALQIPVNEYRLFLTPLPPYPIGSEASATNGKLFQILSQFR